MRTRKIGHFFPGGTVDAFDVWVELEARRREGPAALPQRRGRATTARAPWSPGRTSTAACCSTSTATPSTSATPGGTRSVAYVRLIPPGAADTIHYRLRIPEDCGDTITLTAKVNYRKFSWWNTQWAFAGVRDPEQKSFDLGAAVPRRRQVGLHRRHVRRLRRAEGDPEPFPSRSWPRAKPRSRSLPKGAALPEDAPVLDKSVRERWNDYGIGLLLQGDLKGAEAAFLKVTAMEPGYADGWVNVGRARVQEGNMDGAEEVLRKALELDPELAKTHFFLGPAVKARGRYDEALEHLRPALDAVPARPRRAQPDRPRPVPEAAVRGRDRGASEGPRHRPRGPAGPLQPDALLAGAWATPTRPKREQTLYSASRRTRARSPSPAPTASSTPHDNNERQADPRARLDRSAAAAGPQGLCAAAARTAGARRVDATFRVGPRWVPVVLALLAAARGLPPRAQRPRRPGVVVHRRDRRRARSRSSTRAAPSGRSTCPETMGSGVRVPRLRRRRLARPLLRELEELARPRRAGQSCPPSTATTATARSPT